MTTKQISRCLAWLAALVALVSVTMAVPARAADELPVRVRFMSLDKKTMLTGYLFEPSGARPDRVAAIVMMHGRAGAYSSKADGRYDASTLSKRHAFWGHFWADRGYAALLVDGFGPRGYPQGFQAHSYENRPAELNEVDVRPLDAYGALTYLRSLSSIDGSHIVLQGWSNGGSATLATMSDETLAAIGWAPENGFQGGIALYPACGLHDRFQTGFHPYAPLRIFAGEADEEVSAKHCANVVQNARSGSDLAIEVYPGATHDFDDPGRKRQGVPENVVASDKAINSSLVFVKTLVGR